MAGTVSPCALCLAGFLSTGRSGQAGLAPCAGTAFDSPGALLGVVRLGFLGRGCSWRWTGDAKGPPGWEARPMLAQGRGKRFPGTAWPG